MSGLLQDNLSSVERVKLLNEMLQARPFGRIERKDEPRHVWTHMGAICRIYDANHSCVSIGTFEIDGVETELPMSLFSLLYAKEHIETAVRKHLLGGFDPEQIENAEYRNEYFKHVLSVFEDDSVKAYYYLHGLSFHLSNLFQEWNRSRNDASE